MLSISQLQKKRRDDEGFTLIELLVVVVILGILIAIAIPVYLNYRKSANDKAAQSDLRNAVSALEVCNSEGAYPTAVDSAGAMTGCSTQKITKSDGTTFSFVADSATTPKAYVMYATNSGGSSKTYCYSSTAGGSVATTTKTLPAAAGVAAFTC